MNELGQNFLNIDEIRPYLGITYADPCGGRDSEEAGKALADAQHKKARFVGFAATADRAPEWRDALITPVFNDSQLDVAARLILL
jgi:hypothetical protein